MDRRVTSPTWGTPPPCKQAVMSKHSGSKEKRETKLLGHVLHYHELRDGPLEK